MSQVILCIQFIGMDNMSKIPVKTFMDSDDPELIKILDHQDRIINLNTRNALFWFVVEEEDK